MHVINIGSIGDFVQVGQAIRIDCGMHRPWVNRFEREVLVYDFDKSLAVFQGVAP